MLASLLLSCTTSPSDRANPASDTSSAAGSPAATGGIGGALPSEIANDSPLGDFRARVTEDWAPMGEPGVGGRLTDLAVDPAAPRTLLAGGDLLGVARSDDGGASWQSTFGLAGAEISRFTFNPGRVGEVWVATMSGPHRSLDHGRTWVLQREGMGPVSDGTYTTPIDRVLVDPLQADHLLAFGGSHREWAAPGQPAWGAVWESTDAGSHWSRIATVADGTNLVDAARLPDGTLWVAALGRGLYRSSDGGHSWQEADQGLPHQNVRALASHATDAKQLWVALASDGASGRLQPGGIYHSTDGGATWRAASKGLGQKVGGDLATTARYQALAASASDPDVLYTADLAWGSEALYRSTDGGANWSKVLSGEGGLVTAYSTPPTAETLVIDPTDSARVFAGNAETVLGSLDAGKTWVDLSSTRAAAGGFRGTGYSGLVASRVRFDPRRPGVIVLCGFDGANPLVSIDGANSWSRPLARNNGWGGCTDAAVGTSGRWYVLAGQANSFVGIGWFEPTDGRWQMVQGVAAGLPDKGALNGELGSITVVADADGHEVVLVSLAGLLYRSVDAATTFRLVDGVADVGDMATIASQPGVVLATTGDGVARSRDAGLTFAVSGNSPGAAARLTIDGTNTAYAAVWRTEGGGLWKLAPNATDWERLLDEPSAFELAVDPRDPNHLLLATNDHPYHDVVTSKGVLQSDDGGRTWRTANDGLPLLRISAVAFDPFEDDIAVVGTFGRGHFVRELSG